MIFLRRLGPPEAFRAKKILEGGTPPGVAPRGGYPPRSSVLHPLLARHYIPIEELKTLYYAIFSSHLVYGCQLWGEN